MLDSIVQTFLWVLGIFATFWIAASVYAFVQVKKILKYNRIKPDIPMKQQWEPFLSLKAEKWDDKGLFIGCFTKFPKNLMFLGLFLLGFPTMVFITKPFGDRGRRFCLKVMKVYGMFATRQVCNVIEQEGLTSYKVDTPMIISNHVSWFDIFYVLITLAPCSVVAKAEVGTAPIVRTIADFIQTVYVSRKKQSNRQGAVEQITQRVEMFKKSHADESIRPTYPIVIFPEGTCSNGRSILSFKSGAFNDLAPITMVTLNYTNSKCPIGIGDIRQSHNVFLTLCTTPTLETKVQVIEPKQGEKVEGYMERCRTLMAESTGFKKYDCGFREAHDLEVAIAESRKRVIEGKQAKGSHNKSD